MKTKTASIIFLIVIALLLGPSVTAPAAPSRSIYVGPSASGEAVRILSTGYVLQPLTNACRNCLGIVVGPADLSNPSIVARLQAAYEAGHAVGLTDATPVDGKRLRELLGHRGSAQLTQGGLMQLVAYGKAQRPDGQFHFSSHLLMPHVAAATKDLLTQQDKKGLKRVSNSLRRKLRRKLLKRRQQQALADADQNDIQALSKIFSATPIVPAPPSPVGNPQQNLLQLAESYQSHAIQSASWGQVQVFNTMWAARSFLNNADLYYVFQETDFSSGNVTVWSPDASSFIGPPFPGNVTLIQTSPQSTMESTQETSSVSYTIGGSAGWNETQGLNASISGSVTITNSKTTTIPAISITDSANLGFAITHWTYNVNDLPGFNSETITLYNQWIWEVPFSFYKSSQQDFSFTNNALLGTNFHDGAPLLVFTSTVPLPFGRTFSLQPPVVTGVNPSCVNSGDQFTIQGTGFYPSLVQAVIISGTPVNSNSITTVSDTQINVIAPDTFACHGTGCPVVVETTQGTSNTNFNIVISDFCD